MTELWLKRPSFSKLYKKYPTHLGWQHRPPRVSGRSGYLPSCSRAIAG